MSAPNPSDASRKRLRSESGASSTSAASSPKRAASDSPATPANAKSPLTGQSALSVNENDADQDMVTQGQGLSLTDEPGASSSLLTPQQKLSEIEELKKQPLKLGDTWYIVSRAWYRNWVSACGGSPVKGAPDSESQITAVDNSAIAGTRPGSLNGEPLVENVNIELMPQEAWDRLVAWYGPPTHTFGRKVISEGVNASLRIEFYPTTCLLYFCRAENPPPPQHIEFTKSLTLFEFQKAYLQPILAPLKQFVFRCWKIDSTDVPEDDDENQGYTPARATDSKAQYLFGFVNTGFNAKDITVEEALISTGDRIILEAQDPTAYLVHPDVDNKVPYWRKSDQLPGPLPASASASSPAPLFKSDPFFTKLGASTVRPVRANGETWTYENSSKPVSTALVPVSMKPKSPQPPRTRGTLGLTNLGNTCYMNSALQCLSHLPELTEYFLSGAFREELNPDNPLGTGGELAKSYGSLLQSLFDPESSSYSVAPRDFKLKLARHNPTFSGYMQHDTQELLAFLLDGLHEDLNRIQKKPYVENPDWEGGAELELCKLAREFWTGYKKRNDSVIVDLFQGQYKSTLVCPECQKVSVTFDPFMYLTLPLPVHKSWEHELYFVTWDNERPNYKTRVSLPSTSTMREVKVQLGKWFDADPDNILAADVFQSRIYKFLPDYVGVTDVLDSDTIFFYELPVPSGQSGRKPGPTDPILLPVYTVTPKATGYERHFNQSRWSRDAWGFPFFLVISRQDAASEEAIYSHLVEKYEQATNKSKDLYRWEEVGSDGVMVSAPPSQGSEPDGELVEPPKEESATGTPMDTDPFEDEEDMEEVKLEEVKLPSYAETVEEAPSTPASLVKVGPKPELFMWMVMEKNFDPMNTRQPGANSEVGHPADLSLRLADAENQAEASKGQSPNEPAPPPSMLRHGDGIVCEWDSNVREYYFGHHGMGLESRWSVTEEYVDEEQKAKQAAQSARLRGGITIDDCLNEFVKEEQLGEADPWYCPRCKKHQQATKKFDIWKVPDILVIHLKRFSNSRMLRDKIDAAVDYPIEGLELESRTGERAAAQVLSADGVDLTEFGIRDVNEPLVYDLFAVDEHMGGLGGGHYRGYAKNTDDGKWYHFDDSHVSAVDASKVVTPLAYVLFYRRRTGTPVGGETWNKVEEARTVAEHTPSQTMADADPEPVASGSNRYLAQLEPLTPPMGPLAMLPLNPLDDDTFPPSISQQGSPRSTATAPSTPDGDGTYRPKGQFRLMTEEYNPLEGDESPMFEAENVEMSLDGLDSISEIMSRERSNMNRPGAVGPLLSRIRGQHDGPEEEEEVIDLIPLGGSRDPEYPLRRLDEDYDQGDAVDEIVVEGPMETDDPSQTKAN